MENKAFEKSGLAYFSPSGIVFYVFIFLNLLPGVFMLIMGSNEGLYFEISDLEYQYATSSYVKCVLLFLIPYVITAYAFGGQPFSLRKSIRHINTSILFDKGVSKLYYAMCVVGILFTLIYLVLGGYEKLLLLSTNTDAWAFRIIGYDDRSRFLIATLEMSRRILLPMGVLYLFLQKRLTDLHTVGAALVISALCQFLGAAMTLDRAPILLFFVQFSFVIVCLGASILRISIIGVLLIGLLALVAGVTTFLQYNISTFSLADVGEAGYNFLIHRTILVPSVASVELSFVQFPDSADKLYLAYSRLGALVGRDYVGTEALDSLYVTPVGLVGDVWRNFGYAGVILTGAFLGCFFGWSDRMAARVNSVTAILHSFNALSLACYFIFGVLFSQGVFFQIIFGGVLLAHDAARSESWSKGWKRVAREA